MTLALDKEQCPRCEGDGYTIEEDHDEDGYRAWQVGCSLCAGQGWVIREPCLVCGAPITMGADTKDEHDEGCPVAAEEVQA